jgi:SAM-dependent methyltransferase
MRLVSSRPDDQPDYLQPYARAVKRHGGADFRALLWASRRTQEQRFDALLKLADPTGLAVLDLGCGRADFLDFLIARGKSPRRYVGLEGVRELADAAEAKQRDGHDDVDARIIVADFVREPRRMRVGADVVFCSGALNTIEGEDFFKTIANAYAVAGRALVFNFLSSPILAGTNYLFWHERRDVIKFAKTLTPDVEKHEGYIDGDCTIALWKDRPPAPAGDVK